MNNYFELLKELNELKALPELCMFDSKHSFKVADLKINILVTDREVKRHHNWDNYIRRVYVSFGFNKYIQVANFITERSKLAIRYRGLLDDMYNKNPDQFEKAIFSLKQRIDDNETKSINKLHSSFLKAFTTATLLGNKPSTWEILDQLIQDKISNELVPQVIKACKSNQKGENWRLEDTIGDFRWSLHYSENIFGLDIQLGYLQYNCSSDNGNILMIGANDYRDAYKLLKNLSRFGKCITDKIKVAT